jgi:hypothetical protein
MEEVSSESHRDGFLRCRRYEEARKEELIE